MTIRSGGFPCFRPLGHLVTFVAVVDLAKDPLIGSLARSTTPKSIAGRITNGRNPRSALRGLTVYPGLFSLNTMFNKGRPLSVESGGADIENGLCSLDLPAHSGLL